MFPFRSFAVGGSVSQLVSGFAVSQFRTVKPGPSTAKLRNCEIPFRSGFAVVSQFRSCFGVSQFRSGFAVVLYGIIDFAVQRRDRILLRTENLKQRTDDRLTDRSIDR